MYLSNTYDKITLTRIFLLKNTNTVIERMFFLKISVSSYSFDRLLKNGSITQFDCIAKAKDMGYEGIEFVDIHPHDNSSVEEYAVRLKEECKRLDMAITNYTVGADFINGSGGDTKAEIERVKKQVDLAVLVGATSMRHDATAGFMDKSTKGFDQALPIIADACREVTIYAEAKGVKTMVENHGFFCQDSSRVEKLITTVNHPNFGWLCDMGNFLCADEAPEKAVGVAANYVCYAHAKDFVIKNGNEADPGVGFFKTRGGNYLKGTIVGHGNVPVLQCLSILKNKGYDGFVAVEFEGMEDNLTALQIAKDNLTKYLSMI